MGGEVDDSPPVDGLAGSVASSPTRTASVLQWRPTACASSAPPGRRGSFGRHAASNAGSPTTAASVRASGASTVRPSSSDEVAPQAETSHSEQDGDHRGPWDLLTEVLDDERFGEKAAKLLEEIFGASSDGLRDEIAKSKDPKYWDDASRLLKSERQAKTRGSWSQAPASTC